MEREDEDLKDMFAPGEIVVFNDGYRIQLGEVKKKNPMVEDNYFVYYSTGDTAGINRCLLSTQSREWLCV